MPDVTCSVDRCSRKSEAKGYCSKHYKRWRNHGHTDSLRPRDRVCMIDGCSNKHDSKGYCKKHYKRIQRIGTLDLTKKRNPICTLSGCDKPHRARGYCNLHYLRWRQHGDPLVVLFGEYHHNWTGSDITYAGMHSRIRTVRGRAADYQCVDCSEQAAHWSYNKTRISERLNENGLRYSTDCEQYSPRCVPCHSAFDEREDVCLSQ